MRSSLARHQPVDPADDDQLRAMRAALWHKQGIVVIPLEEIRNDWDRQHVANVATKLYGEREGRA